ncbi:MAG: aminodeoxychorismate/anthranilate synthase component II [Elusimicrobiota bacterium]
MNRIKLNNKKTIRPIVVIDNFDSFVYNLVQYIGEMMPQLKVFRNNAITVEQIVSLNPQAIIISPGPCGPPKAGISVEVIKFFAGRIPILGVCLGHQSIGYAFGGKIVVAKKIMHGKTSLVHHDGKTIFQGVANPLEAIRYHSLLVERKSFPKDLVVTAWTKDGEIMGLRHKKHFIEGVQFHPESILTKEGKKIVINFLKLAGCI